MEFVCKYAKPTGEIVKGVFIGQSSDEVRHRLQDQGFLPMDVHPRGTMLSLRPQKRRERIRTDAFVLFNQQFVALIKAGLPIVRSLDLLKIRIRDPQLRRHIENVRDQVFSGVLLSSALRSQEVFPTVYVASIFAGERSGNLVEVITRYISFQKTLVTVRKRFINSLIYPAFLVVLSMVMVGVIVTFVIPQFSELYDGLNVPLPYSTRVLIGVSVAVQRNLILIIPAVIGLLIALRIWGGTESGRDWVDQLKLKAPIVGHLWTMFSIAQLSRTLATLLQGGTPLLASLEVARDASGNRVIAGAISKAVVQVREGRSLSDSLEQSGHFPELALEMIRVGEQTGSLPEMLSHVADFYDQDVDIRSATLLGWIEPVILIFVAIFIAAILISLYLPIFSIRATI